MLCQYRSIPILFVLYASVDQYLSVDRLSIKIDKLLFWDNIVKVETRIILYSVVYLHLRAHTKLSWLGEAAAKTLMKKTTSTFVHPRLQDEVARTNFRRP